MTGRSMEFPNHSILLNRSGRRSALLSLSGICLMLLSGCQCLWIHFSYIESLDQCQSKFHAWHEARTAWSEYSHHCDEEVPHRSHFKLGFLDGFSDVATGGNGCLPSIPPQKYWKYCYETAEGRLKINAYFQGFSTGVQMALETGHARSPRLPTSQSTYANLNCPTCPTASFETLTGMSPEGPQPIPEDLLIPSVPPSEANGFTLPHQGAPVPGQIAPLLNPFGQVPRADQLIAPEL